MAELFCSALQTSWVFLSLVDDHASLGAGRGTAVKPRRLCCRSEMNWLITSVQPSETVSFKEKMVQPETVKGNEIRFIQPALLLPRQSEKC